MTKKHKFIPFRELEDVWKVMEIPEVSPFMYYDYMAYMNRETRRELCSPLIFPAVHAC